MSKPNVLLLVSFRKELFPVRPEDYQALKERGVTGSRMSKDLLPVIQKALLKDLKIEILSWTYVYGLLIERFQKSFPAEMYEFKADANWVLIHTASIDKEHKAFMESRVDQLSHYASRYGFKVSAEHKIRKSSILTRLMVRADPDLLTSRGFGSDESEDTQLTFAFSLSPSCRIRFVKRKSPSGTPSFTTVFEDRIGESWEENTSRSFFFSYLKPEECRSAIAFFAHLISIIPSSERHKGV